MSDFGKVSQGLHHRYFAPPAERYSYSVGPKNPQTSTFVGLCASCAFMREIHSDRGSTFYMCQRSATDPHFPKYPRLPMLQCRGYEASPDENK